MNATTSPGSVIENFEQIIALAKARTGQTMLRAAVVSPSHPVVFEACKRAIDFGLITPVMIGDPQAIKEADAAAGQDLGDVQLIEADSDGEATRAAVRMATAGEVDVIVRGGTPVPDFVKVITAEGTGFVGKGRIAGHVAFIKPEKYDRVFALTDAAAVPEPDLKQKMALLLNLIAACLKVGIDPPRIAVLAAVEVVYPQMPVTIDAAVLSKMNERGQIKGAFIDGPLSFDCAVSTFAAESKGIRKSEVAGQANAMLAPNMETAHGIYKAMALYGHAQLGGVLYGGRAPVALAAASDSADTLFHSIALACLMQ
jgi:phosphate butyryltransferase